jgi:hypothetical protein
MTRTHMLSSSKRNALAEILIPRPLNQGLVVLYHLSQLTQRASIEPLAVDHTDLRSGPQNLATARPLRTRICSCSRGPSLERNKNRSPSWRKMTGISNLARSHLAGPVAELRARNPTLARRRFGPRPACGIPRSPFQSGTQAPVGACPHCRSSQTLAAECDLYRC